MSKPDLTIIESNGDTTNGVSGIGTTPGASNSGSDGTVADFSGPGKPEILFFEPQTASIFGTGDTADDGGNARRTKDGKIDRRTRAGRNAGTGSTVEAPTSQHTLSGLGISGLSDLLFSIHLGLASLSHIQEFELDEDESAKYAKALAKVAELYAITPDPKKLAIANLLSVAGKIYGTRFMAYKLRVASERAETPAIGRTAAEPAKLVNIQDTGKRKTNGVAADAAMLPSQLWSEPAADNIIPGL